MNGHQGATTAPDRAFRGGPGGRRGRACADARRGRRQNCPELPIGDCSTVTVPLDRTGAVPGTVNLAVARVPAARQPSRGTILFLAGGPGRVRAGRRREPGRPVPAQRAQLRPAHVRPARHRPLGRAELQRAGRARQRGQRLRPLRSAAGRQARLLPHQRLGRGHRGGARRGRRRPDLDPGRLLRRARGRRVRAPLPGRGHPGWSWTRPAPWPAPTRSSCSASARCRACCGPSAAAPAARSRARPSVT